MVAMLQENPNAILIVLNEEEKERILNHYFKYDKANYKDRIWSWDSVTNNHRRGFGHPTPDIYIDNLDIILSGAIGYPVKGGTVTDG